MDRKNIFVLSIFTLITAIGWIIFDVYHASIDTTIPQNVADELTPISSTFDRGVITKVGGRLHVEPLESGSLQASSSGETKTATKSGGT